MLVARPSLAADLRLEIAAQRDEDAAFVERVRQHVDRIRLATVAQRPDIIVQSAADLERLAERRRCQLEGDAA